jgi:hypothetical protein
MFFCRYCTYPQELVFELVDGTCRIESVELLVHESKIPSAVKLLVGSMDFPLVSSSDAPKYIVMGFVQLFPTVICLNIHFKEINL